MTTAIKVSGLDIAARAKEALSAPGFESQPGYCQRWVRQVIQSLYGDMFDAYWRGSAGNTAEVFQSDPWEGDGHNALLGVHPTAQVQTGDLLFKFDKPGFPNGHVGIYVSGPVGMVAENSSAHWGPSGDTDARGERDLEQFGHYDLIVRLSRVKL